MVDIQVNFNHPLELDPVKRLQHIQPIPQGFECRGLIHIYTVWLVGSRESEYILIDAKYKWNIYAYGMDESKSSNNDTIIQ